MKKHFFIFLSLIAVLFLACNDPVFFQVSIEDEPIPPRINGSPTKIVELNGSMFVASGNTLHEFNGENWIKHNRAGRIYDIAATASNIYLLHEASGGRKLVSSSNPEEAESWNEVDITGNSIQSIFAVGDALFIGIRIDGSFVIQYYNGSEAFTVVEGLGGRLFNGAVISGSDYFFSTNGAGIFTTSDLLTPVATPIANSEDVVYMGIITLPDSTVAAITRGGALHAVTAAGAQTETALANIPNSRRSNGMLAIWRNPGDESQYLLIAGRQDAFTTSTSSGFTYGYVEMELSSSGAVQEGNPFREPGVNAANFSSVIKGHNERYRSSIGRFPIISMHQFNDILYASTQQNGIWSYKDHSGSGTHWNAER